MDGVVEVGDLLRKGFAFRGYGVEAGGGGAEDGGGGGEEGAAIRLEDDAALVAISEGGG